MRNLIVIRYGYKYSCKMIVFGIILSGNAILYTQTKSTP